MLPLALLGLLAGALTTVAGAGGGMMLILALGAWWGDPVRALAVATPALLVGNLHRTALYRRDLPWPAVLPWVLGSTIGALTGGVLALQLPPTVLKVAMVLAATAAVASHFRPAGAARLDGRHLGPAGVLVGLASTAGGAGLLANPVLQTVGLRGGAYLSALSAGAVAMHVGRLVGLGLGGGLDASVVPLAAALAATLPLGNLLGRAVRDRLRTRDTERLEVWSMAVLVGLSVTGALR